MEYNWNQNKHTYCDVFGAEILGSYGYKLKSVVFTEDSNITAIGKYTFANAYGLANIELPDSLTGIGNNAFQDNTDLTVLKLPEGVTDIGTDIIRGTIRLKELIIPDSLINTAININDGAFDNSCFSNSRHSACTEPKIVCQGDIAKCQEVLKKFLPGGSACASNENRCIALSDIVSAQNKEQCESGMYVWNPNKSTCERMKERQCNQTKGHFYNGNICMKKPADGKITCTNPSYKVNDGYCDRIRYTPAEAAQVLRDDNTNEVTITFKK